MAPVSIRSATHADYETVYGRLAPRSLKAWAAIDGDKLVGLAGFSFSLQGRTVLFGHISDELRAHKTFIVRSAKALGRRARHYRAVAIADPAVANSAQLLEYMGGQYVATLAEGALYSWTTLMSPLAQPFSAQQDNSSKVRPKPVH